MSIILYIMLMIYTYIKFDILINRLNPAISVATLKNVYESSVVVDLNLIDFKIAFGVEDYNTATILDDPNFVEWHVKLNTLRMGVSIE